jgi:hypothetical protein
MRSIPNRDSTTPSPLKVHPPLGGYHCGTGAAGWLSGWNATLERDVDRRGVSIG